MHTAEVAVGSDLFEHEDKLGSKSESSGVEEVDSGINGVKVWVQVDPTHCVEEVDRDMVWGTGVVFDVDVKLGRSDLAGKCCQTNKGDKYSFQNAILRGSTIICQGQPANAMDRT